MRQASVPDRSVSVRETRVTNLTQTLFEIREEVDHIGHWAQSEYPKPATNDNWGNPYWSVNDFPSNHRAKPPSAIDASRGRV